MKSMKNVFKFFLVLSFFMLSLSTASALEIGVAWVGKSGMAKRVSNGFDQQIKELAPDIGIEYNKELSSMEDLAKLVAQWEKKKDGMVLLRSNAAKWLGKNPPSIPTFIGGCNHPVQLGAVKNMDQPEGKITGVTYFLPVDTQFEIFQAILPKMKSVLLLVEEGHPSSLIDQAGTKNISKKLGITYNEKFCTSNQEALAVVKQLKNKVSAIIIGNQALNIDNAENIINAAGKTPVLSYSSKPVKVGALGGFVADDGKLGKMLAESVVDVLVKGKAIKNVLIKVDPKPTFYVNAKTAQKLGIEIPYQILEAAQIIE